jgi:hypothetical protein
VTNCTLYTYKCVDDKGTAYLTTVPSVNCTKRGYNVNIDYNMAGPLVVPRMIEAQQVALRGYYPLYYDNSSAIEKAARYLRVDSIDFPDLVNITGGMYITYAHNVSSLKLPKLKNIGSSLELDLSGGPAISLSFPSLRIIHGILIKGKIDA